MPRPKPLPPQEPECAILEGLGVKLRQAQLHLQRAQTTVDRQLAEARIDEIRQEIARFERP